MNTQPVRLCCARGESNTWTRCTFLFRHEGPCNSVCPCPPHRTHPQGDKKVCVHCGEVIQLYAIAYEARVRANVWEPGFLYLHAKSDGDARWQFINSESPDTMRHMRIVGVAPVLGYLVDDKHGDELTV